MLELRDLGYRHPGQPWLLRGVNLSIGQGDVLAVLAPNGRGKTTLLRCAAGLARPSEGAVSRTAVFGYVPQAHQVMFAFSVLDMVIMGRARHLGPFAAPRPADRQVASAALERVGMSHLAQRPYPSLSGGEQQLVLVARALASDARLLLLDEPASALDLSNQALILALLGKLAAEGFAIVFSTHQPDHAEAVATRVGLLYGPGDFRVGPTAEALSEADLSELYGIQVRRRTFTYDIDTQGALTSGHA
jgi:iron complex transport system ATP-binding protein